ncbi:enoyl-[acyl-carrier-protein] reductase, mitochondrial-like [Panonychus citri]|uniref:enoyl-[acyl-carrier-protein] reductase, mitochondrial-like n=1 Tax=Panonychus citri TaxID=50023 RepID=UPI002308172F|nr:enoyl-[acyl-carrier-protein] reductase, mitochondrial-like [Panonychus citri]XP_053209410.1 enoyl-[acyl-carrier-protein] reductase, mitochondrial-like [Panonychus citri]XP_053209411.1 enoyl-[acyl-carrier-protein] reductase, mitochondrial-like [Panonychus citri]
MIKHCARLMAPLRTIKSSPVAFNSTFALMYRDYGDPISVVSKVDTSDSLSLDSPLEGNQVLIQYVASTINPSDINTIQGTYAIKPKLPAVGGNEGVGKVIRIGSQVTKFKPDDWVIPARPGLGTWRSHAIAAENDWMPIDNDLELEAAAQITVNPPTAYRMLHDYVKLKQGDCVLQNGANSAVGLLVIQMCKAMGVKTINVIRARPNPDDMTKLVNSLTELGGNHIITEEDLRNREVMDSIWTKGTPKPILTLNCINGDNATNCVRHMAQDGIMVTYGGMSKKPLIIPTGPIIFNHLQFVGFWVTRWKKDHAGKPEYYEMMNNLTNLFKEGKLKAPKVIPFKFDDYKNALEKATAPFIEGKVILTP